MRCDALVLDHPAQHRSGAIGGVADEATGLETETLLDAVDHRPRRVDLLRSVRGRSLDVDDDPGLQIDKVVGRVGEERRAAWGGFEDTIIRLGASSEQPITMGRRAAPGFTRFDQY